MSIYGLADCNNFFVSCERVFRPALEGRPAVVLSSNDGCIVARSDEAKALGVKMAQPAFQAKDIIERHSIAVISGNLQFYTDMSNRVMQVFGELVPAVCPSSKQMGLLSVFHKGGSGSSLFDVKPLGVDGSSGGFGWSVF